MSEIFNVNRRDFIKTGVAVGGGLMLAFYLPRIGQPAGGAEQSTSPFAPNAFVRIGTDDTVTVIVNHSEMGQGPYTSIPMVVAEELEADWSKVRYEGAPVDPAYNHTVYGIQMTGGSSSTWSEYDRVRKAGAAARMMLIAAAADTWQVEPNTCRAENGQVIHAASGRQLSFGELAEKAEKQKP